MKGVGDPIDDDLVGLDLDQFQQVPVCPASSGGGLTSPLESNVLSVGFRIGSEPLGE
jgi:hypothetical protein